MKTIKALLLSPSKILCQLFYGGILTFIFCFSFEKETHYVKEEITVLLTMMIFFYLMKLINTIPSYLELSAGGIIATVVIPPLFFFTGLLVIAAGVSGVWNINILFPNGLNTDLVTLLSPIPKFVSQAEAEGLVFAITFQIVPFILKVLKIIQMKKIKKSFKNSFQH